MSAEGYLQGERAQPERHEFHRGGSPVAVDAVYEGGGELDGD